MGGDPSGGKCDPQDEESSRNPPGAEEQPAWGGGAEAALCPLAHVEVDFGSGNREQRKGPAASEQVCVAAEGGAWWWEPLAKNWGGLSVGLE